MRRRGALGGALAGLLAACGAGAAQNAAHDGTASPPTVRATPAVSVATLRLAPTRTPTVVSTPEPIFTALQALAIALPQLRQLHRRGLVMGVSGGTRVGPAEYLGHVREWVIDVWAPEQGRRRQYSVVGGVLQSAATSSMIPPGGLAHIMAFAGEAIPSDVMDSDRAIGLADAAGAAEFKETERAQLRTIELSGRLDGSLVWYLFISRIGIDGIALDVDVDARTGAIRRYQDERVMTTPTPRPPPTPPR